MQSGLRALQVDDRRSPRPLLLECCITDRSNAPGCGRGLRVWQFDGRPGLETKPITMSFTDRMKNPDWQLGESIADEGEDEEEEEEEVPVFELDDARRRYVQEGKTPVRRNSFQC